MTYRGGKGLTVRKARKGSASDAGSIPARSTASALLPMLLLEGRGGRHPAPAEEYDGNSIMEVIMAVILIILAGLILGGSCGIAYAIGSGGR